MTLTTAQIAQMLTQSSNAGLDADELDAVEWFLVDRAANMNAATRLDVSLALLPPVEKDAAASFLQSTESIRKAALGRGKADLMSMSDSEWDQLTQGGNNASA